MKRLQVLAKQIVSPDKSDTKQVVPVNSKVSSPIFSTITYLLTLSPKIMHNGLSVVAGSPGILDKFVKTFHGSGPLSNESIQAFNNILFLVNSIPPSLNSLSIFNIMLRSAPTDSDLLPFLAQVKIPRNALGGTDYKTFITTLSRVQQYLPSWYYSSLVLGKALNNFDAILLYAAQRFAREIKVDKAVSGALVYPAIMTMFGTLGVILLLTRILPQNIQIFESMGMNVPDFLKLANYLVRSVEYHWFALLYLIPSSLSSKYVPFKVYLKMQYLKLHTPLGKLRFLQDKATLLHTLSLLDKEQIASKLLLVCTNISGNVILQQMVEGMASLAKYGASADEVLSYMLDQKHIYSPYEIAYLQACFMSGKHKVIQDGLKYVSQMVLKDYTTQMQTLLKILNPLTIVMVGVLVLIIALLGIYPLIELTSAISAT
jgi:type II secretory pathway component PulF